MENDPIDPRAQLLTHAIALQEGGGSLLPYDKPSGDEPNAPQGTAGGRYQFTADTWKANAGEVLGDPNALMTDVNQNKVAYTKVKKWLDAGYTPAQVASMWNAGPGAPDAWKPGTKQAHGDTPDYVKNVQKYGQQLENGQQQNASASVSSQPSGSSTNQLSDSNGFPTTPLQTPPETQAPEPDNSLVGKIKSFAEGALPVVGSVVGGIGGSLAAGLVASPTVLGIPAAAYAGGIAGSALLGAAGEAGSEALKGQQLDPTSIGATGVISGAGEAVGAPLAVGAAKVAGLTGEALYKNVGLVKTAADYAARAKGAIIDALTPRLTGKAYQTAAKQGLVSDPSTFGTSGINGEDMRTVQNGYEGLTSAASALGKKVSQIIKTGPGNSIGNVNRVNSTIDDFAENIVKPFYEQNATEPSLDAFVNRVKQLTPPRGLSDRAIGAWNQMKDDTINIVASHLKGEQTGLTSLSQLREVSQEGTVPSKTPGNFWDARKIIDQVYDDATKGKVFTDETLPGAKAGLKSLRGAFKDFLSDSYRYPGQMDKVNALHDFLNTPQVAKMNKTGWKIEDLEKQFGLTPNPSSVKNANAWDSYMKTLSGLYNARDSLATKVGIERGLTGLGAFMTKHPIATKLGKIGLEAAGVGAGVKAATGLLPTGQSQ